MPDKKKGRARMTSMDFLGAWPSNESKRFFFIRHNFEYVEVPWNRGTGFSKVVVNQKPMDSQSRDPHVLKDQMMDAGIARREVPQFYQRAAEEGFLQKVVEGMAKDGSLQYAPPVAEAEVSKELPAELEEAKSEQPDLFDPDEMKKTRRPWGHWMSWYGRGTMKREGVDERLAKIEEAVEAWEWEDDMSPEQFTTALREAGADPQFVDLGSIGKYIVVDEEVYNVSYHDSGKSISEFIWGLCDYELAQYAEEQGISSGGWDEIGHGSVVYHCTSAENVSSIMEHGINPRNQTRGLSNRGTGSAVFISYEPIAAESYGDSCFEIDLGAMKDAGVMPELQQEDPIVEAKIRGSIAWRLGDQSGDWGESALGSEGIEENTLVMYGKVPPQFIKFYSGPEELMEQYASGTGVVKTAVEDYEIEDYGYELQEPYGEMSNIDELDPDSELDEDWAGSNLYDVLHDVFEWSGKIAMWRATGNPMHERKIENLTERMERYADLAITFIGIKMQDWLDNHFNWDKWWSEMASAFMTGGRVVMKVFDSQYPIDIQEEIIKISQRRLLDGIYSFVDGFVDDIPGWFQNDLDVFAVFFKTVLNNPNVEKWLQEDYNDPETAGDDPREFIDECGLESEAREFADNNDEQFKQFVREHVVDAYYGFDEMKAMFDVYTWGQIVEEAAKQADVYQQWKDLFPGIEDIEKGIQKAVSMLEKAQTPDQKVAALSYALNVEHYFGNVMLERMAGESLSKSEYEVLQMLVTELESITPLDYEQLEALSNIEVIAATDRIDKTAQVWVRTQVFVDRGETYDIDKLIKIVKTNHVVKIPIQDLQKQLFDDAWGENGKQLSPMDILNNPTKNKEYVEHMQSIRIADMKHPVVIRKDDMMIVDGYHRLARAFLEGRSWIKAVFAEPEQMNECRVV